MASLIHCCKILRLLHIILAIVFITVSCTTRDNKTSQKNNKFDILPLPIDSSSFFFNTKNSWRDTVTDAVDTFLNAWYSKMLFALKEPILKDYKGGKEIYRFTWLRTFNHPVSIRLEKQDDVIKLFSKVTNGAGGYEPGKIVFDTTIDLSQKQVDITNSKLNYVKFWSLPTELTDRNGNDGSEWIIEVYKDGRYHMVVRWTPEKGTAFRAVGEYLLSISQRKNEMTGREHGDY